MSSPLLVEIIAFAPTAFYHCTHCEIAWREMGKSERVHQEQLESSLPEDLAREYQAVSDWVREMFRFHCEKIAVRVIDAASVEGVYKSLRYNARQYPAVVVNQRTRFMGGESLRSAAAEVNRLLSGHDLTARSAQAGGGK